MALVLGRGPLRLLVRHWSAFGISMPIWLAPRGEAYEFVEGGRSAFTSRLAFRSWA
jgi:hypothetical protein